MVSDAQPFHPLTTALATIGLGLALGTAPPAELRLDGMTHAEAEHAARSGALYDVATCPPPRRVVCRPRDGHWLCSATFPHGGPIEGDLASEILVEC